MDLDLSKYEGHTEGEWRLDIGTGWIVASRGDRIQVQMVARMRPTCVTDQWEADAHLIADAQLLLAEVRRLSEEHARDIALVRVASDTAFALMQDSLTKNAELIAALRQSHARLLAAAKNADCCCGARECEGLRAAVAEAEAIS